MWGMRVLRTWRRRTSTCARRSVHRTLSSSFSKASRPTRPITVLKCCFTRLTIRQRSTGAGVTAIASKLCSGAGATKGQSISSTLPPISRAWASHISSMRQSALRLTDIARRQAARRVAASSHPARSTTVRAAKIDPDRTMSPWEWRVSSAAPLKSGPTMLPTA